MGTAGCVNVIGLTVSVIEKYWLCGFGNHDQETPNIGTTLEHFNLRIFLRSCHVLGDYDRIQDGVKIHTSSEVGEGARPSGTVRR